MAQLLCRANAARETMYSQYLAFFRWVPSLADNYLWPDSIVRAIYDLQHQRACMHINLTDETVRQSKPVLGGVRTVV